MAKLKFRSEVIKRWKTAGCPEWDYDTTKRVCLEVNGYLTDLGQNPAPRFREEIGNNNESYIRKWILGCHFEWLNPRKSKSIKTKTKLITTRCT